MVFLAIPSEVSEKVEDWFVGQIGMMGKNRLDDGSLPRELQETPPDDIGGELKQFIEESGGRPYVKLTVERPDGVHPLQRRDFMWAIPVVLNHVERFQKRKTPDGGNANSLDGYSICFENRADEQVHIAFDIILVSEPYDDDEGPNEDGVTVHKRHLTPLEEELSTSINAANSILNEMRYMEKREQRMRKTADSINQKVRWFSYISILVLFGVTYVQVTYLKRYFRKKKLM